MLFLYLRSLPAIVFNQIRHPFIWRQAGIKVGMLNLLMDKFSEWGIW